MAAPNPGWGTNEWGSAKWAQAPSIINGIFARAAMSISVTMEGATLSGTATSATVSAGDATTASAKGSAVTIASSSAGPVTTAKVI